MDITSGHTCVFCSGKHGQNATTVTCAGNHNYQPSGDTVLLGQIVDGKAMVTIHPDVTTDEVALLVAALMDRISNFQHIKDNPTAIMSALMGAA